MARAPRRLLKADDEVRFSRLVHSKERPKKSPGRLWLRGRRDVMLIVVSVPLAVEAVERRKKERHADKNKMRGAMFGDRF